jgi:hypothetical protein
MAAVDSFARTPASDSWAVIRARYVASFFAFRWRALFERGDREEIPAWRPSLASAAKMALDEVALALVATWAELPPLDARRRSNSEILEALALYSSRGWLDDPRSYHVAPPPLEDPAIRPEPRLGLPVERLSFRSEYAPRPEEPGRERWLGFERNHVARAWILRHPGGPRPWVFCIHPFQLGSAPLTLRAFPVRWLHQKLGLNVVLPVLPLHGSRRTGWKSGDRFLAAEHMNTVFAMAQTIWELRRLVAWARTEGATAIGCYGLSLGGYTTALLVSIEPAIDCAIAGVPASSFLDLERRHTPPYARTFTERAGIDWAATERVFSVISPLAMKPHPPRDRLFLFAGLGDRLAPPDHVRALWRHWQRPRIHWYDGGHLSFRWDPGVKRLVADALVAGGLAPAEVSR